MYKFKREKQISFTDFKQRIAMLGGANGRTTIQLLLSSKMMKSELLTSIDMFEKLIHISTFQTFDIPR